MWPVITKIESWSTVAKYLEIYMGQGLWQLLLTCLFCPILWALAWACRSFWGFQSESKMTTVSADAKLIPRPPARVDNKKQKSWAHKCYMLQLWFIHRITNCIYFHTCIEFTSEPSALKWSKACFLISPLIEPSSLYKMYKIFNLDISNRNMQMLFHTFW